MPSKGSGQSKSAAKPKEQQSDDNGSKTPGGAATPTPKADEGKKAEKKVTVQMDAWKQDIASQRAAGVLAGTVTSMIPGGAPLADEAFKKGILPPRTANHQLGMAIGELLGGAVQLFGSWCMFGGGAVVTTTGIGAIIGAPAMAVSVGLAGAGILNITSGVQNLIGALNALSSGGGVSQGPAAPQTEMHHTIPREVRAPRSGSIQPLVNLAEDRENDLWVLNLKCTAGIRKDKISFPIGKPASRAKVCLFRGPLSPAILSSGRKSSLRLYFAPMSLSIL